VSAYLDDLPDIGQGSRRKKKVKKKTLPMEVTHSVVIWQTIKCPACGSENVPVYSTQLPIRYHKCRDCKTCFKSVEK